MRKKMSHDLNEMEFDALFSKPIRDFTFCTEEVTKMLKSRIDHLTEYLKDGNLESSIYKSSRTEINKAIDGLEFFYESALEKLKKNLDKAFDKLEDEK